MTEREAIEGTYQLFAEGWAALHPGDPSDPNHVPYTFRDEVFGADQLGALEAWVRVSIQHTASDQVTHGSAPSRKFERRGNVFVQVFAPIDQGVGLLATLAGDARTVLEGQRIDDLCIYAGRTEESPGDGRWAMTVVVLPFRYTEVR